MTSSFAGGKSEEMANEDEDSAAWWGSYESWGWFFFLEKGIVLFYVDDMYGTQAVFYLEKKLYRMVHVDSNGLA